MRCGGCLPGWQESDANQKWSHSYCNGGDKLASSSLLVVVCSLLCTAQGERSRVWQVPKIGSRSRTGAYISSEWGAPQSRVS